MKTFFESLKTSIYDRLNNPLALSFVVSWVLWNYRFLFILFSGLEVPWKLKLASQVNFPEQGDFFLRGILYPTLSSVGFIIAYPYISRWVYDYWHTREQELKALRDKIEGATLLTADESRELRTRLINAEKEFGDRLTAQGKENDDLKKIIANASKSEFDATLMDLCKRIEDSWKEFQPEIDALFEQVERLPPDRKQFTDLLGETFNKWVFGIHLSSVATQSARDLTLFAISYDSEMIYHPTIAQGERRQEPLVIQVLQLRSGQLTLLGNGTSEQFAKFFPGRPGSNVRLSRVVFKDFPKFRAIVAVECHVNVIDRLPKFGSGPTRDAGGGIIYPKT